jgi:hypothetical protein
MKKHLKLILFFALWIITYTLNNILYERSEIRMYIVMFFYLTNLVLVIYSVVKIVLLIKNKDYSHLLFPLVVISVNLFFLLYGLYVCSVRLPS